MQHLSQLDYIVFLCYFLTILVYGLWIYRRHRQGADSSRDYFLAEGSLTWWAIGASLIASNISAEQFIGMSGAGFKIGIAIASYEWMAAATLIIVGVFFMPVYLKNKIFTMPQFLRQRYSGTVAMIMAVFWLLLYVVVNLTSILYLGAIAINSISGVPLVWCMYGLAAFAVVITLGGMKVIGYTDIVQVFFLIIGGLVTTYIAIDLVAQQWGETGVIAGFSRLRATAGDHFHAILSRDNPSYLDLPGISVLVGGMWIANLNYWGCNQYITQRALGADLPTARKGLLFAGFLKLLMPVIVVLPGIAAYALHKEGLFASEMMSHGELNPDRAYPVLLNLLPVGLKGLAFAALTAAIVASLAGKANSIATIFTLDIYKRKMAPAATEAQTITVGKITIVVAMLLAILIAPMLGIDKKGGFQYIQEYTGFVSPGVFAMFALGLFWRRATASAALFAMIGGFLLSVLFKVLPTIIDLSPLSPWGLASANATGMYEIPFLDRMATVFLLCVIGMIIISLMQKEDQSQSTIVKIDTSMFRVSNSYLVGVVIVLGLLAALYTAFW